MLTAVWLLTLLCIGLWSLAAWALHALLTLDTAVLADLKPWIDAIPHADLISQWIPGWQRILEALLDLTRAVLGWVGGAAPVIVWGLWGMGVAVLLAVGGLLTVIVRLIRIKTPTPPGARA